MAKLPSPRFNLKAPKSKSETLIFLVFRYRGKKLLYSTGLNIIPSDWDFKKQRPVDKEKRPDLWSISRKLDDFAILCKSIYIDTDYGVITVESFKKKLDHLTGRIEISPKDKSPTLFEFIDLELEDMVTSGMKKSSFEPYKRHAEFLKLFAKEKGGFDFNDIDWDLRIELIDWLVTRNVQLSYGNKTLSILRQFMERARRKQLHTNVKYQGNGWLVTQKKAKGRNIILTTEELQKLADLELYSFESKVRDLFLIGAGTGQRFSDYSKYTTDNFYRTINGTPILSVISQKTDIPAKVPLNIFPWLLPTLERLEYTSPKISMQKFNMKIKELCQRAGIDENVLKVTQYMGRKARIEKSYIPKYKEVASHTCRRSFATNLYRMGYQLGQIMPMTGHVTESQLREYIGIDAEQNAETIARSIERRKANRKNN